MLTFLLATTPIGAQTIVFDPHLDLPTSASATGWTGRGDPNAQFDLERATTGGLTIALFVPQVARDAASLAAAQQAFTVRDAAIHANPKLAGCARSPADVRRIVASGRIAIVESLLNAWPLGEDPDAFDLAGAGRQDRRLRPCWQRSVCGLLTLADALPRDLSSEIQTFAAVLKDARQRWRAGAFHEADRVGGGRW